ncbi:MAG: hypothetical protein DMF81_15020 [Acidobacteria bacterium]|nr:MAG: hypothetical protein DMF81_15020 [Acidobacteriota bacterium]
MGTLEATGHEVEARPGQVAAQRRDHDRRHGAAQPGECGRPAALRSGREVPLIPRYLDLLILLLRRRREAVHRREIFETVWSAPIVRRGSRRPR